MSGEPALYWGFSRLTGNGFRELWSDFGHCRVVLYYVWHDRNGEGCRHGSQSAKFAQDAQTHLSAPGLSGLVRTCFERVKDPSEGRCEYSLADALMSGLAMFMFKSPSPLQFDRDCRGVTADPVLQHNLRRLYGVAKVPSDSSLRRRLDRVLPEALHRVFEQTRRHKALADFQALGGHYLLAVDGTGQFASERVHCASCCIPSYQRLATICVVQKVFANFVT